ncbi:aa3-type cytochrome c oxidase subunit IV [Rhizobium sp. G21]|uniref:aa3-type cytochrome c oxidase subunit IV n=1 Tax=Rhizobium sp. G21 TaxID=2758439 RepID=UPI0016030B97|nr:aa3-type cytochrome c oxidase subunit IV [Rhizobium sp. G21]MBB1250239.1 aa3-type cytochrome c oxidase subunit IV [Rhizobium sp. G21]
MAEHHTGPAEVGASMDYAEHEKTYSGFLWAAKYGTMAVAVLLIAMTVGFFTGAGFIFSVLLFIVLTMAGFFLI